MLFSILLTKSHKNHVILFWEQNWFFFYIKGPIKQLWTPRPPYVSLNLKLKIFSHWIEIWRMIKLTCKLSFEGKGAWIAPKSNASGFTQRVMEDMLHVRVNTKEKIWTNPSHERIWNHFFHQNILPPFFYKNWESWDSYLSFTHDTMRWFPHSHSNGAILARKTGWKLNVPIFCVVKTFQNDCQLGRIL